MTETSSTPISLPAIAVREDPVEPADHDEAADEEAAGQEAVNFPNADQRAPEPAALAAKDTDTDEDTDPEDTVFDDMDPEDTDPAAAEAAEAEAVRAVTVEPAASEPGPVAPEATELTAAWPRSAGPTGPQPVFVPQPVPVQARRTLPGDEGPLLTDADELAVSWSRLKAGFVDNPRGSVAEAATLIEDATETLVAALRARQDRMRDGWDRDGRDTESLRQALLTYQALFNRIADL